MYPKTGLSQSAYSQPVHNIEANFSHLPALPYLNILMFVSSPLTSGHKMAAEAPDCHPHLTLGKGQGGKISSLVSFFFLMWNSHDRINCFELCKAVACTLNIVQCQVPKHLYCPQREPLRRFLNKPFSEAPKMCLLVSSTQIELHAHS